MNAAAFFDIQTLRLGHVARAKIPPVDFSGTIRLARGDREITGKVIVHILAHASGFIVIRPTILAQTVEVASGAGVEALHQLERAFWDVDYPLSWHVPGADTPVRGGVRHLMNWVFLDMYERLCGRPDSPLTSWATEGAKGCERLHEMAAKKLLFYPFPVSFGTQIEIIDLELAPLITKDPRRSAQALAQRLLSPDDPWSRPDPVDLGQGSPEAWWFLTESVSLTLGTEGGIDARLDSVDVDRTQLLEFLTLRRTTLTCVQRDTQRVLTERHQVSRGQIERWQHIIASTTDDYVVHSRIGRLLAPVKRHHSSDVRIRDLVDLETQVRENLAWFQQRLDTLSEWTGGLVGATVGAAAMVLSLQEVVKALLANLEGLPEDRILDDHGILFSLIMLGLMAGSFLFSVTAIRVVTSKLRPFTFRLSSRRRRRPRRRKPSVSRSLEPTHGASAAIDRESPMSAETSG